MLTCKNVSKKYVSVLAVDNLSMELERGKIYALLGPNGSGKTTLMKMIGGLCSPTSGEIYFEGNPLEAECKQHIAYMPTEPYFYNFMTCKGLGKYYQDFFKDFSMDKYMQLLNEMDLKPNLKLNKMSTGMMAKCKIAVTLARESKLVMLDEPLNGIDIIARDKIINTIVAAADDNKTILMSSHLVDELEKIVDNAIFMKNGQLILSGNAEAIREENGKSIVEMYKELYA